MYNRNLTYRHSLNFLISFFVLITLIGLLIFYNLRYSSYDNINSYYIIILTASILIGVNLYFFIKSAIDFYGGSSKHEIGKENILNEYEIEERVNNRVIFIKRKYIDLENEIQNQIRKLNEEISKQLEDNEPIGKEIQEYKKKEIANWQIRLIDLNRRKIDEIE
jgi:hypothetical protein